MSEPTKTLLIGDVKYEKVRDGGWIYQGLTSTEWRRSTPMAAQWLDYIASQATALTLANQRAGIKKERVESLENLVSVLLAVVHRDGGHHTEDVGILQSIEDAEAVFRELTQRAEAAEAERNDADLRAGAAERKLEHARHANDQRSQWLDAAKESRGYHNTVSFDVVWAETCAKADERDALRKDAARARKMFEDGTVSTDDDGAVWFMLNLSSTIEKLAGATDDERNALLGETLSFGHISEPERITALIDAALAVQPTTEGM